MSSKSDNVKNPSKSDNVKNPSHYTQFKMQPIEFFRANKASLDFLQMCAIKYICRYKMKNGVEDLDKAINYLQMMREDWLNEQKEQEPPRIRTSYVSRCA